MAVDTASKRLSILLGETLPVPSGSFGAADRLHLLELYSGFGSGGGSGSGMGPAMVSVRSNRPAMVSVRSNGPAGAGVIRSG